MQCADAFTNTEAKQLIMMISQFYDNTQAEQSSNQQPLASPSHLHANITNQYNTDTAYVTIIIYSMTVIRLQSAQSLTCDYLFPFTCTTLSGRQLYKPV